MWRAFLQLIEDYVTDALRVAPQMRIPEPQCLDTVRLQKLFALGVVTLLFWKPMLPTVEFDCQFRFLAKEINTVNAGGMLAAEFVAAEAPVAQPVPDELFRPRFRFAKLPGAFDVGHE